MLKESAAARASNCPLAATINREIADERQPNTILAFNASCGTRPRKLPKKKNGAFILSRSQNASFTALDGQLLALLTKPTGSGKTIDILALALSDLAKPGCRKQVIIYSMTEIAPGFGGPGRQEEKPISIEIPGRGPKVWTPIHASESTVESIIKFLRSRPSKDPAKRMLICSHLALVLAHEEMLRRGYKRAFKGTSLYIDECHHISWDTSSGNEVMNGLAKIVAYYCKYQPGKLVLATATFMRPDGQVLPPEYRDKFAVYELPMHEHLASMVHLKGIRFHFVMASAVDAVESIIGDDPQRPTLLWIPNNVVGDAKRGYVERLVDVTPDCIRNRIYDFTDDEQVPELRKKFHRLKLDPTEYPCLGISLRRLLEGLDSPMASRGIILGLRGIRDVIQMVGRFIRDFEGKEYADIYIVVDPPSEDEADVVEHLEDSMSAILIAMVAGWQYGPPRKPRSKVDRELSEKVGKILSNPEAATLVLDAIAHAVARHGDGKPDQLTSGMHESMRRLAEERPDLAAMKDSAVRARFVEDVNQNMAGPAAEAEKKLKFKLDGLKGARELTGLKLTPEQNLARSITVLGFRCGATSMKMMRDGLMTRSLDLTLEEVTKTAAKWWQDTGQFPHTLISAKVCIKSREHSWKSVDSWLRRTGSSLANLKLEITGYCKTAPFPYDQVAEEARVHKAATGDWPSTGSGRLKLLPTNWMALHRRLQSQGSSLQDFLESRFGRTALYKFNELWNYITTTRLPGFDIATQSGYRAAYAAGVLSERCPAAPPAVFKKEWSGWPKRRVIRGEAHSNAKLCTMTVKQMRRRFKQGATAGQVASEFKVSKATAKDIRSGRSWIHVK